MKAIALSLTGSLLLLGIILTPFTLTQAPILEGKDHPILLKRMVVTATALPR
ncbi:hypothetical protein [Sphingobium bisphenolivorans]|uniref:hypothetical protein n=1 Tax=Sphingobium bisphenolivorans TaxID=1335760 RepID=UPI0003A14FCD|nr:hypothetical protein [Sphingobium bisphenolivorans]